MLKLYNKEHVAISALTNLKDYKLEYVLSGEDLLEFSLSIADENINLVEEEGYIRTKDNEYVIKAIDPSQSYKRFNCVVNVESIKGKAIKNFDTSNNSITETIRLAIAGTGWILGDNNITKRRTVRLENTDALEVLREVRKVFRIDYRFDAINRIIHVYENFGTDKGVYFSDELNLIDLQVPSETYNYATRLYCYGKEGLTIKDINNGKEYIENFQYSKKVVEKIWKDERYTIIENLKEDAIAKLEELSKPKRSYQADVADLAKLSDEYKFLDFFLGDTITLINKQEKFRDKQRIVKYVEYPDDSSQNTCELGNTTLTFEELQKENEAKNQIVDNITTGNTVNGSTIDRIHTDQIYDFETNVARITNLSVINADIKNLQAVNVTITGKLNVVEARIGTFEANVATIDKLTVTHSAYIADLQASKASITQVEAVNATISVLEANVGKIETLVNGNLSSENIQAGSITARELASNAITAGSTVIGEGAIGNAQISNLDAIKLNAGTIDTSLITIAGPNSNLRLKGNRLQVFVGIGNNQIERVSLGDIFGDGSKYGFLVRGADGKTVIMDENGVKSEGITNGSITNDKINSNANIDGAKLNINSVVTKINGATTSISGTKIDINGNNLSTKLSQQDTTITEHKKTIDSHTTSIEANTNAIKLKVDTQTYITDKTNFNNTLSKANSDISLLQEQISLKVEKSDITNAIDNIEIGSTNLVNNSAVLQNLFSTVNTYKGTRTVLDDNSALSKKCIKFECTNDGTGFHMPLFQKTTDAIGNIYTWSFWAKCSVAKIGNVGHESGGQKNITITTEWKKFEHTWKFTDSQYSSFTFYQVWNAGEILYIRDFQIVKGNKVGDWTPSIADIQNDIDTKVSTSKAEILVATESISQSLSNLTTTVNKKADGSTVTTLSNKVTGLETSLNSINGKVSNLETTTKTSTDNITNLQTDIKTVKSDVATLNIDLTGITQRVSSTETTTKTLTTQANQVDGKINDAKNDAITSSVGVKDTRNTNENPQWYFTNYSKRSVDEFKTFKILDINTSTAYGVLTTNVPWNDSTGGYPVQTFRSNSGATYERKGTSNTTWGNWQQIEDTNGAQLKANKALTDAKAYTTTEITTTNNRVTSIENNLSSITSRVTNVESKQTTVSDKIVSLETWKKEAEQKITDASIISTVSKQFYSKGECDTKYTTQSTLTQLVDSFEFEFRYNSNNNLLKNSAFLNGTSYWGINETASVVTPYHDGNFQEGNSIRMECTLENQGLFQRDIDCSNGLAIRIYANASRPVDVIFGIEGVSTKILRIGEGNGWSELKLIIPPTNKVGPFIFYTRAGGPHTIYANRFKVQTGGTCTPWHKNSDEIYSNKIRVDNQGITIINEDGSYSKTSSKDLGFYSSDNRKHLGLYEGALHTFNPIDGREIGYYGSIPFPGLGDYGLAMVQESNSWIGFIKRETNGELLPQLWLNFHSMGQGNRGTANMKLNLDMHGGAVDNVGSMRGNPIIHGDCLIDGTLKIRNLEQRDVPGSEGVINVLSRINMNGNQIKNPSFWGNGVWDGNLSILNEFRIRNLYHTDGGSGYSINVWSRLNLMEGTNFSAGVFAAAPMASMFLKTLVEKPVDILDSIDFIDKSKMPRFNSFMALTNQEDEVKEENTGLLMDVSNIIGTPYASIDENGNVSASYEELLKLALKEIKGLKNEVSILKEKVGA